VNQMNLVLLKWKDGRIDLNLSLFPNANQVLNQSLDHHPDKVPNLSSNKNKIQKKTKNNQRRI